MGYYDRGGALCIYLCPKAFFAFLRTIGPDPDGLCSPILGWKWTIKKSSSLNPFFLLCCKHLNIKYAESLPCFYFFFLMFRLNHQWNMCEKHKIHISLIRSIITNFLRFFAQKTDQFLKYISRFGNLFQSQLRCRSMVTDQFLFLSRPIEMGCLDLLKLMNSEDQNTFF